MTKEGQPRRIPTDSTGGGHLRATPSLDNILAVGRARADQKAREYLGNLRQAQEGLDQAQQLFAVNALNPEEFSIAKQEVEKLLARPDEFPALKQALERVKAEEKPAIIEAPKKKAARKEKPKEAKLTLPKGLKLSSKAKELISFLAPTSKDATLAGTKIDKELYKGIPNRLRKSRRSSLISFANKQLEGTEFKIINVTPPGSNKGGSFYLERPEQVAPEVVVKPEKIEKAKEPKGETIELPDGQKLSGLGKLEKQIIEGLLVASSDHPVSYSELAKFVYGNVSEKTAKNRLRKHFSRVRKKLDKIGWKIVNLTPPSQGVKGKEGLYYLAPKEAQVVEEKAETKKEAGIKKEVKEVSEKTKLKLTKNEEALLRLLKESPIPLNSEELSKMLSPKANRKKAHQNLSRTAYSLKKKLVGSGEELVGPGKGRPGGDYYLRPEGSNEIKETSLTMLLPDGQKMIVVGETQKTLLERLLSASITNPVSKAELEELIQKGIEGVIGTLRGNLRKLGWRIVNQTTPKEQRAGKEPMYYLAPKEPVQEVLPEISVQEEPAEHVVFEGPRLATQPIITRQDIPEVPYTPTPEEMRNEEETRILDKIISAFISSGRIRFEDLQKQLKSDQRIKIRGGERWYYIYEAPELKAKFFLAFNKIREEAQILHLREAWSEDEKKLWENVQLALNKFSGGDVDDFRKKVREEIERSERDYYRRFPPADGLKKGWIKIHD